MMPLAHKVRCIEYAIHLAKGLGADGTLMYVLEVVCYDLECGLGVIGTKYENGTIGTGS